MTGARQKPDWTPSEDVVLTDLSAARISITRALARLPGRSQSSIRSRMERLKLSTVAIKRRG